MNSLQDVHDKLRSEFHALSEVWRKTRGGWQDAVGAQFEQTYWSPVEQARPQFARALEDLDLALRSAIRQVRDLDERG